TVEVRRVPLDGWEGRCVLPDLLGREVHARKPGLREPSADLEEHGSAAAPEVYDRQRSLAGQLAQEDGDAVPRGGHEPPVVMTTRRGGAVERLILLDRPAHPVASPQIFPPNFQPFPLRKTT